MENFGAALSIWSNKSLPVTTDTTISRTLRRNLLVDPEMLLDFGYAREKVVESSAPDDKVVTKIPRHKTGTKSRHV
jgi:hypothetical protein